ncbi:hypothetical protein A3197_02255 [Candidatus Thiodiazotropha endoloripes]|nr:hypothetical protein A3197_02255 [Candidatus Thiodiazotropha endoloripes]
MTRASYLALIFVPIIAGLWPSARAVIIHHNQLALEATGIFDKAETNLQREIFQIESIYKRIQESGLLVNEELAESSKRMSMESRYFAEKVQGFLHKYDSNNLSIGSLPLVWFVAYIGSLLVVIGNAIYQANAPDIVQKYRKFEFVQKSREEAIRYGISDKHELKMIAEQADSTYEAASDYGAPYFTQPSDYFRLFKLPIFYSSFFYLVALACIAVVILIQFIAVVNAVFF